MTEPSEKEVEAVAQAIAYDRRPPLASNDCIGPTEYWSLALSGTEQMSLLGNARAAIAAYEKAKAEERG